MLRGAQNCPAAVVLNVFSRVPPFICEHGWSCESYFYYNSLAYPYRTVMSNTGFTYVKTDRVPCVAICVSACLYGM